jgi:curved DNA binding protein
MKNKEEEKHKKEINTNSESENQEEEEEEEEEGEEDKNKEEISPEDELKHADIITKYKNAGDIANKVLAYLVSQCLPGKYALDLCMEGDKMITDQVSTIFSKGKIEKGVAFPTCISINNCLGHYSPLMDDRSVILKEGDIVKIDLGVHIDGCIALVAHTTICTNNPNNPTTGKAADVIAAAYYASEIAHRLVKPGKKNSEVTENILKVAKQFGCEPMEGVLSHQLKKFVIDGNKVIINKQTLDQKVEEFEFQEYQAFAIDIVMSTGEGKSREMENRTTIFKRNVDQNYLLKMKASRYVFNEINQKFPTFPFTLRALDEKKGRLGITELLKHNLVSPYPVLYEKEGEIVAQFKFTVLILPSSTNRITGHPVPYIKSEKKIEDPSLNEILKMGTKRESSQQLSSEQSQQSSEPKQSQQLFEPKPTEQLSQQSKK